MYSIISRKQMFGMIRKIYERVYSYINFAFIPIRLWNSAALGLSH